MREALLAGMNSMRLPVDVGAVEAPDVPDGEASSSHYELGMSDVTVSRLDHPPVPGLVEPRGHRRAPVLVVSELASNALK